MPSLDVIELQLQEIKERLARVERNQEIMIALLTHRCDEVVSRVESKTDVPLVGAGSTDDK